MESIHTTSIPSHAYKPRTHRGYDQNQNRDKIRFFFVITWVYYGEYFRVIRKRAVKKTFTRVVVG